MYFFRIKPAFVIGFLFGFLVPYLTFRTFYTSEKLITNLPTKYEEWFLKNKINRSVITMDELKYGIKNYLTESEFLYQKTNVMCIVLVRKENNAEAISNTWGKHCNNIIFYTRLNLKSTKLKILKYKVTSSWHLLCEILLYLNEKHYTWAFFINDDSFALIDNLRLFLTPLTHFDTQYYYLGHSIRFWGVTYNVPEAGYVLNRASVLHLVNVFNSSKSCIAGGKFWKQEAFYLGKHLQAHNITPTDTRDDFGLSTFHGHGIQQLLFPGSETTFSNYYRKSIYPVNCCSKHSVTLQTSDAGKMYLYYFLFYTLQVFVSGNRGNQQPPKPKEEVWRQFLKEEGIESNNVSPEQYYNLWKTKVADPNTFNEIIRQQSESITIVNPASGSEPTLNHNITKSYKNKLLV